MPFNWLTNPLCSGHSPLPLLLALTVPLKTHCTHSLIARRIINYTVEIDAKSKSPFKRIWWYATHKLWYHHSASKINIRQQTGKCTYVLVCTCMHICYHSKANTQICTNRQLAIWNIHCSAVQCACCHCNEEVTPWCRRRVSPFRMQREPAPWPSLALSRLLLACPFALWMRQSPAYRPPVERPNQCFVHTEMPPRQHYHLPGRWRRSKRERKEQENFNVTLIVQSTFQMGTMTNAFMQGKRRMANMQLH